MGKIGLSREILRYFKGRKMEIQLYQHSWDAVKAVLRGEWQMVQPLWEAIRQFKTNNETCDYHRTQRLNFWELYSQINESLCPHKNLYPNVCSGLIHDSRKVETTQIDVLQQVERFKCLRCSHTIVPWHTAQI